MPESESGSNTVVADENGGAQVCTTCQQLDLSINKFIIRDSTFPPTTSTGADASPALPNQDVDHRGFQLNSGDPKRIFARLDQMKERSGTCRFCDLAYRAVQRYSGIRVSSDTTLVLIWEIDGRQTGKGQAIINRTRRIRLSWRETSGKEESVYMVLVAPKGSRRINSDAYAASAKDSHFLGRGLVDNKEKQALMKSLIDLCAGKHGAKCRSGNAMKPDFKKLIKSTFFGVVDVIDMILKPLPVIHGKPERYVALSYVWGKNHLRDKPYTTTRANVMTRIQHGGLENAWERLPRTIQETILLVARLGERYVWIDSLCIVQDSLNSWELNAKAMHLVYGNAHFTICAADGDADDGLRARSSTLRAGAFASHHKRTPTASSPPITTANQSVHPRQRASSPVPISHLNPSPNYGMTKEEVRGALRAADAADLPPLTAECLPNVRLLVSKPPEAAIEDSMWNKRGWTFQERLLSHRCLIFAEGQVYFQCRSTVISQHIFTDGGVNGWSLDWTNAPLRTLGELPRRAFWFYMKCVPLYTGRTLTKPRDILTAFQGTSWLLQHQMNAPLFYGLPSSHFDLALLWMGSKQLDRRRQSAAHKSNVTSCTQDEMGNCSCKMEEDGYGGKEFPSWSWSGWIGGKSEYPSNMIEGCLSNVQEWLRDHTWIRWYVRDYEGNLRPLWDKNVLPEDRSTEERWRGYAGRDSQTEVGVGFESLPRFHRYYTQPRPQPSGIPGPAGFDRMDTPRRAYYNPRDASRGYHTGWQPERAWTRQTNAAYLNRVPPGYYAEEGADQDYYQGRYEEEGGDGNPGIRNRRTNISYNSAEADVLNQGSHAQRYNSSYDVEGVADPQIRLRPNRPSYMNRASPFEPVRSHRIIRAHDDEESLDWVHESSEVGNDAEIFEETESFDDQTSSDSTGIPNGRADDTRKDNFGRPLRPTVKNLNADKFEGILPDNPFSIIRGPFPTDTKDEIRAMPILQFWTWQTELLVAKRQEGKVSISAPGDLCQYSIVDKKGDWCGSIVLPAKLKSGRDVRPGIFIALSDAKTMTEEECPVWNYYIPKAREESEWDLFHVMMLERNHERALWERVAIGKVFLAAFCDANWSEIKLG